MAFFLIYSMVSGLLKQLHIFWQLYLIELLGLFFVGAGRGGGWGEEGATQVVALDTSMAFNRVWRAGKRKSYGISGQIFHLFFLLLVMYNFQWFWMAILYRNIELMLEFIRFHSWSYPLPTILSWPSWWCYL